MATTTVKKLAEELKRSSDNLLEQLRLLSGKVNQQLL
jgi:hypothetical protein